MSPVANNNIVCNIMFRSPRGATRRNSSRMVSCMFQSTFPRGERHTANHGCLFWEMFQSTLPRGERHQFLAAVDDIMYVSIHAPAWGATKQNFSRIISLGVSIHAPAWGATKQNFSRIISLGVSIHAPAWGATSASCHFSRFHFYFNPRSRVGSDTDGYA